MSWRYAGNLNIVLDEFHQSLLKSPQG